MTQTSNPAVPAVAFSHLGFYVRDIAPMEDFYTRALGFMVTDRGNLGTVQLVFMSRDPEEHHQVVLASGRPDELRFNLINQISFRVEGIAALRRFYELMVKEEAAGRVTELRPVTHGNAISLYLRDPEGNRIELFFDTPWYCEQPVRETVDFTQSDAEIMSHAEATARSLPKFMPRAQWVAEMKARMAAGKHG
jgi:catechol 2,3-dioxygenase-like lactoylglutathione lyase family enzyme